MQLFFSFGGVFSFCEFGERVSMAFDEINIEIDQLKWHLLPCKIQRMLPIIFMAAQEPVEFHIFGSTSCNRKAFKKVS